MARQCSRRCRLVGSVGWIVLALFDVGSARCLPVESSLPPIECVELLRHARIAHQKKNCDEELQTLQQTIERFPQEVEPVLSLVQFYSGHGDQDESRQQVLARLSELLGDPERPLPAGLLGVIAQDQDLDDETLHRVVAAATSRLAESTAELPADFLEALGFLQKRAGDLAAATTTLEKLWQKRPTEELCWTLYKAASALEKWEAAERYLEILMETNGDLELRLSHVRLLGRAGRFEEQMQVLQTLLEERPVEPGDPFDSRPELMVSIAWNLRDAGRHIEAEQLLRQVLAIDPEHEGARPFLIHLYGSAEERRALATTEAEQWREESDPYQLFEEGTQRLTQGDVEGSLGLLQRAAEELPDLEAVWYNLGMAAYRLESWEQANSAFARAVELNADRAASHFFRGISLVQLKRCAESVAPLETAVALEPDRILAHYHLSVCHQKLGNHEAAKRHGQLYSEAAER